MTSKTTDVKAAVRAYWEARACGTQFTEQEKFTRDYFDEIEEHRYAVEPEIFSFAQFSRFHQRDVLEIGVGAATDFLQWIRSGARAHGVDLTSQAIDHAANRARVYGLTPADLRVADCENLPYADDTFDLVYSWGVLHHTPDTPRAVAEAVRVTRPGGAIKIMMYHRHSLTAFWIWCRRALLAGRPWKSVKWAVYHHLESLGTKAYTRREAHGLLSGLQVCDVRVRTTLTHYDRLGRTTNPLARWGARTLAWLFGGDRVGWFLLIDAKKCRKP